MSKQKPSSPRASTGRSARNKGSAAEREVAAILESALGIRIRRKLGQARDGGDDIEVGVYRIEVKRRETLAMDAWCKQVEDATPASQVPLVIYRRSHQPWRVVVRLTDFLPLIAADVNPDAQTDPADTGMTDVPPELE